MITPAPPATSVQIYAVLHDRRHLVAWHGRDVVIALDANALTNAKVQAARRTLAQELARRGARVRIAEIPRE